MKSFKAFMIEQQHLEEAIVKKGAVAAYALQGRKHGIKAVRSYQKAKQALRIVSNAKSTDQKVDALVFALIDLLDGLVAQRQQIGSVSAQVTSVALL
ncbi:hypothetical protein UM181_02485 [Alphaproteobacteria bacterium US3C007]|nr:hypothetical protein UM181_02485 [Alphaproteobacteria bacterium US3C007]